MKTEMATQRVDLRRGRPALTVSGSTILRRAHMHICEPHSPHGLQLSEDRKSCGYRTREFLRDFSSAELKDFHNISFISAYQARSILFVEQQRPHGLYLICEGHVKTSVSSRNGNCLTLSI